MVTIKLGIREVKILFKDLCGLNRYGEISFDDNEIHLNYVWISKKANLSETLIHEICHFYTRTKLGWMRRTIFLLLFGNEELLCDFVGSSMTDFLLNGNDYTKIIDELLKELKKIRMEYFLNIEDDENAKN